MLLLLVYQVASTMFFWCKMFKDIFQTVSLPEGKLQEMFFWTSECGAWPYKFEWSWRRSRRSPPNMAQTPPRHPASLIIKLVIMYPDFGQEKNTHYPMFPNCLWHQLLNQIFFSGFNLQSVGKTSIETPIETATWPSCQGTIDRTGRLAQTDPPALGHEAELLGKWGSRAGNHLRKSTLWGPKDSLLLVYNYNLTRVYGSHNNTQII